MNRSKVFGIGLSKTGTTSLSRALEILGHRTVHFPKSLDEIAFYDAATNSPVARSFEVLDRQYPGSKFIYTVRDKQQWLESCKIYFTINQRKPGAISLEVRAELFGTTKFDKDLFSRGYDAHEEHVLSYFASRPSDLLVLDVCAGNVRWEPLCSFLGVLIPKEPFPFLNEGVRIDEVVIRLLHAVKDVEQVTRIANVPPQFALEHSDSEAYRTHDPEKSLEVKAHPRIDKIISRACTHFGGTSAAAVKLGLNVGFVKEARNRHLLLKIRKRLERTVPSSVLWLLYKLRVHLTLPRQGASCGNGKQVPRARGWLFKHPMFTILFWIFLLSGIIHGGMA